MSYPAAGAAPSPYSPPATFHRPVGVAILAALIMIFGVLVVILGLLTMLLGGLVGLALAGPIGGAFGAAIGFIFIVIGAIVFVAGHGLWRMRSWAFWLTAIMLVLMVISSGGLAFVMALVLLVYLVLVRKHFNT